MLTVLLLVISNVFMTYAWYGHLKFKEAPLLTVIVVSWLIAFFEYCFQVPANRWGHGYYSAAQLKILQEVITLAVFAVFSVWYLGEGLRWNHAAAAVMLLAAVYFVFGFREPKSDAPTSETSPTKAAVATLNSHPASPAPPGQAAESPRPPHRSD
jgi:uncharacterized protein (DUF486 family)